MKYIKLFEQHTNILNHSFGITISDVDEFMDYLKSESNPTENYLTWYREELVSILTTDYHINDDGDLDGIENFPDTITLYRIIDKEYDLIDQDCLGVSWTYSKEWLYNEEFQNSVGFDKSKPYYIVEAVFKKEYISVDDLCEVLVKLSHERELRVKNRCTKPIKFKVEKY